MAVMARMRERLLVVMKESGERALVEKSILRVAIGAIQTLGQSKAQGGKVVTEEQEYAELRKIMDGNSQTLTIIAGKGLPDEVKLRTENEILQTYLPTLLSKEQIQQALFAIQAEIQLAKEGPATGLAMKYLKSQNLAADGKLVVEVIRELHR